MEILVKERSHVSENTSQAPAIATISAGPFKLRYVIEGTGHPAIVVGSSYYYPRVFSKKLRNHLQFIFMDHRGFAPSPGPVATSEFELETVVDDIDNLRQRLGLDRVAVIGHSGHSYMVLQYAKKYPTNTSYVIMIGISPDLGPRSMELADRNYRALADSDRLAAERDNLIACPDEELAKLPPDEAFIRSYVRNAPRVWYNPRYDCTPLWEGFKPNMDVFGHLWGKVFAEIDITEGLENFDRPVFLALGRYDFIVGPPATWDPIRPRFKDLTIKIFEKSGHTPQFEEQELFDESLLAWMKAHGRPEWEA
jgi:proline iminopeptidase